MDRLLDGRERQYWLLGRKAAVNTLVAARLRPALPAEAVRARLDALQRRHPLLGARIEEGGPAGPRFVAGAPPIPLRLAPRPSSEAWVAEAERELNAAFAASPGPLARAVLVGQNQAQELLLCYHHAIGDVLAGVDLLPALVGAAPPTPSPDAAAEEMPVSALLPRGARPGWRWAADMVLQGTLASVRQPATLTPEAPAPIAARHSGLLGRTVPPAAMQALLARARAEGTTVHGALCAAGLLAIAEELGLDRPAWLGCRTPIDLRGHLARPVAGAFGIFAFGLPTYHRLARTTPFWDVARDVRAKVRRLVERRAMLPPLAALEAHVARTPPPDGGAALEAWADRVTPPLVVSNVGVLPDVVGGDASLEGVAVAATMTVGSGLMVLAATHRGALALSFVHPEPLVGAARAARLADGLVARLADAARP